MSPFILCKRFIPLFLSIILAHPALAAASGKRVALVIGNSAYQNAPLLNNPVNDAEDIAKTLSALDFEVIKGLDLDKAQLDGALRDFASSLVGANIGVFYYAGHGLQVSGQNYLVPVNAKLESPSALDFETVRLDVIQRIMENETQTNVLILDACRDNPLTRNLARSLGTRSSAVGKGLAAQESGAGTLISYSTQPGNVALDGSGERNSPFAAALARHLPSQGKDLPSILVKVRNDVMAVTGKRQVPWEHSALTSELVLAAAKPAPAPKPAETAAARKVEESADASAAQAGAPKTTGSTARPVADAPVIAPQELKARLNQLAYGLNRGLRVFVTNRWKNLGECQLQFAEASASKMEKIDMHGGDYFEFTTGGVAYRATLTAVADEDCTLDIAPAPNAKADAKN